MLDRETRRAKILEARGRARRDNRAKSAHEEVKLLSLDVFVLLFYLVCNTLKKTEKKAADSEMGGESELKEADPIEKAEKDFWKIIEDEKRKRDKKTAAVSVFVDQMNFCLKIFHFHRLQKRYQLKAKTRLKLKGQRQIQQQNQLNNILF